MQKCYSTNRNIECEFNLMGWFPANNLGGRIEFGFSNACTAFQASIDFSANTSSTLATMGRVDGRILHKTTPTSTAPEYIDFSSASYNASNGNITFIADSNITSSLNERALGGMIAIQISSYN